MKSKKAIRSCPSRSQALEKLSVMKPVGAVALPRSRSPLDFPASVTTSCNSVRYYYFGDGSLAIWLPLHSARAKRPCQDYLTTALTDMSVVLEVVSGSTRLWEAECGSRWWETAALSMIWKRTETCVVRSSLPIVLSKDLRGKGREGSYRPGRRQGPRGSWTDDRSWYRGVGTLRLWGSRGERGRAVFKCWLFSSVWERCGKWRHQWPARVGWHGKS